LRFNPRPEAGRLLTRALSIDPTPIEREDRLDQTQGVGSEVVNEA